LVGKKRVATFERTLESTTSGKKRPNSSCNESCLVCCEEKKKKDDSRKYRRYLRDMSMANEVPRESDEWDAM
jgi:hypothetical protein